MSPRLHVILCLLVLSATCQPLCADPDDGYTAGQAIEWYDRISAKWESGTYKGTTPGKEQPIIWRRAGDANSELAYAWEHIRQPAAKDTPAQPAGTNATPAKDPPTAAGAPLTEDEVLTFLRQRLGTEPFADSARLQKTKDELAALIKKRGTAFRHESAISPFAQKLSAYGMTSEVMGPLGKNFGAPNPEKWLFGTWVTAKTGLPVTYRDGSRLMRWTEVGALDTGRLTLRSDGTYEWDTHSAQGVLRGKWHSATTA